MMKRLVIATHNQAKASEMITIIKAAHPDLEVLTLADFPGAPEPEETGDTYGENAVIKAESAHAHTGEWCLADDAGLEIKALPDQLGVHSKRFAGEGSSFAEKIRMVLEKLEGKTDRGATFRCWVALKGPNRDVERFWATLDGRIAKEPRGEHGFGYDPIFFVPELGKCLAELTQEEKHKISHRGKVLKLVNERISELRNR